MKILAFVLGIIGAIGLFGWYGTAKMSNFSHDMIKKTWWILAILIILFLIGFASD